MSINPIGPAANPAVTAQAEQTVRSPVVDSSKPAASAQPSPATPQEAPSLEQVQQAAKQVQALVQAKASNLEFSLDKDSGKTIVKIIDTLTDEVIRQIPSEEMVALAHALDQMQEAHGVLLKNKA